MLAVLVWRRLFVMACGRRVKAYSLRRNGAVDVKSSVVDGLEICSLSLRSDVRRCALRRGASVWRCQ